MNLKERSKQLKTDLPTVLIALTIKYIPNEVWIRSQEKSVDLWKNGKPKKWYYALQTISYTLQDNPFSLHLLILCI